jgi:hypothetical protein
MKMEESEKEDEDVKQFMKKKEIYHCRGWGDRDESKNSN